MQHANIVGGSSAERFINCTLAKFLNDRQPKQPASLAAQVGTAKHFIMESCLVSGASPEGFIGETVEGIEITDEMIGNAILPALNFLKERLPGAKFWVEQKVGFLHMDEAWGYADVLFHDPVIGWGIIDWKFGKFPVPATSVQLQFYLAAARHLPWFGFGEHMFTAFIVQPDGQGGLRNVLTECQYDVATLNAFEAKLEIAYEKYLELERCIAKDGNFLNDPKFCKTGDHCQWCTAKMVCPLKRQQAAVMEELFSSAPQEKSKKKTALAVLANASIADIYNDAVEVKSWCDQVINYVKKEFDEGRTVPGLERKVQRYKREWSDDERAIRWLRTQGIYAKDYYKERVLKSPEQLLKEFELDIPNKFINKVPHAHKIDTPKTANIIEDISNTIGATHA